MVNEDHKKKALHMIQYGLYILTSRFGDQVAAGGVSWVSQASFKPPLVMVAVNAGSTNHALITKSGFFALNILGKNQTEMGAAFFAKSRVENNAINGYPFESGATGSPLFPDTPAFLECRLVESVQKGDHTVMVGEIVNAGHRSDQEPVLLRETKWKYSG